jgi:hypothetical protein
MGGSLQAVGCLALRHGRPLGPKPDKAVAEVTHNDLAEYNPASCN